MHDIRKEIPFDQATSMIAFHAITGCNSVSPFAGHSKKTTWHVFRQHHKYLLDFVKGQYSEGTAKSVSHMEFLMEIRVMKPEWSCSVWKKTQGKLPPISDATQLPSRLITKPECGAKHISNSSTCNDMGWTRPDGHLVSHLLSLPPI